MCLRVFLRSWKSLSLEFKGEEMKKLIGTRFVVQRMDGSYKWTIIIYGRLNCPDFSVNGEYKHKSADGARRGSGRWLKKFGIELRWKD